MVNAFRATAVSRQFWAVVACLSLGGCNLFSSPDERAERAEALLERGAYNEAMVELKNASADDQASPKVALLVARASLMLGDVDSAGKALGLASTAKADAAQVDALRARLWLKRGENKQLLEALDAGSLAVPELAKAVLRAQALAALNRCEEAIPLARQQLHRDARDGASRIVIADCYLQHGNAARATQELAEGAQAEPSSAQVWFARGRVQRLTGERSAALVSWNESARHADGQLDVPQQLLLFSGIADLQIEAGELDGLRATYQQLLRVTPQAPFTELVGARVALMQGKLSEAVDTLRRLATTVPDLSSTYYLLASGYIAQGNFEQALQAIGWLEHHVDDPAQVRAVRALLELPKVAPDSEEYALRAAAAQIKLGQVDLARAALAQARTRAPQSPRAPLALARLELLVGHGEAALALIEPMAKKFPTDDSVAGAYSEALAATGHHAEAAQLLEKVAAKHPSGALAIRLFQMRTKGGLPEPLAPLERWLANHPADLSVRAQLAEALRAAADNRRAAEQYALIANAAPNNVIALNNLAWLYYLENDPRALAMARRAWELAPRLPAVIDTYGWLLVESGAVQQGLELLQTADAAGGVAQPEVHLHYLAALSRAGKGDQARELLAVFLAETPQFANQTQASRILDSIGGSAST